MESTRPLDGELRATGGQPPSRSAAVTISLLAGRLAELVPPPPERCGRPPLVGAPRVLLGALRGLFNPSRAAEVALDGETTVAVDLRTAHGRRIFGYGFCEPAARLLQSLLRAGDVVIDGGANIGMYTVLAAARVGPEGCVVSCEPSPTTMALLRANVDRNKMDWVRLREVALAEGSGRMRMHVFEPGSGYTSFAPAHTAAGSEIEVQVTTIDELAADVAHRVSLVKLDVEGAELRALRGAVGLLEGPRPDFIIELEPEHLERQGSSVVELRELFDDAGYVGYSIGDRIERLAGAWDRPTGDPNILVRPRERAQS
jgi:FkbM family methyltransferase